MLQEVSGSGLRQPLSSGQRHALHPEMPAAAKSPADKGFASLPFGSRSATQADASVGRQIRECRRAAGLSLKVVAGRIGVTTAQLHRYEVGTTRVAASRLMAISGTLGVGTSELMGSSASKASTALPWSTAEAGGDLVELVEIYSSLGSARRRNALLQFCRALASPQPMETSPSDAAAPVETDCPQRGSEGRGG